MKIALFANETTLAAHLARFGAEGLAAVVLSPRRPAAAPVAAEFRARHPTIPLLDYPDPPASADLACFADRLAALSLDLIVVHAFSKILPAAVFSAARRGAVNLHGGPLPEMRGANVVNWAVALGRTETAVTLHRVVEAVDAGPVIAARRLPIRPEDDARTLRDRLVAAGLSLLDRHLPAILAGRERSVPQDETRAVRFRRRTDADGRIDWNLPAETILNLVRALVPPWPGAHFEFGGRRFNVRRARVADPEATPGPGRFAEGPGGIVLAGCGRGTLELLEIEARPHDPAGRSPVPAGAAFARGGGGS